MMTLEERRLKDREKSKRYRERHPERAREARRRTDAKRRGSKPRLTAKPKLHLKGVYADLRQWLFDKRGIKL